MVAARILHLVEPPELESRQTPGLAVVESVGNVIGGKTLEMIAQFGVEVPLAPIAPAPAHSPAHSAPPSTVLRIWRIASARRAQLAVSSFNCARPLGVNR